MHAYSHDFSCQMLRLRMEVRCWIFVHCCASRICVRCSVGIHRCTLIKRDHRSVVGLRCASIVLDGCFVAVLRCTMTIQSRCSVAMLYCALIVQSQLYVPWYHSAPMVQSRCSVALCHLALIAQSRHFVSPRRCQIDVTIQSLCPFALKQRVRSAGKAHQQMTIQQRSRYLSGVFPSHTRLHGLMQIVTYTQSTRSSTPDFKSLVLPATPGHCGTEMP